MRIRFKSTWKRKLRPLHVAQTPNFDFDGRALEDKSSPTRPTTTPVQSRRSTRSAHRRPAQHEDGRPSSPPHFPRPLPSKLTPKGRRTSSQASQASSRFSHVKEGRTIETTVQKSLPRLFSTSAKRGQTTRRRLAFSVLPSAGIAQARRRTSLRHNAAPKHSTSTRRLLEGPCPPKPNAKNGRR